MDDIWKIISAIATPIGLLLTSAGLALSVKVMRNNHDWNRRQYAMNIVGSWSQETGDHSRAIEEYFPSIRGRSNEAGDLGEISKEVALKILRAEKGTPEFEIRFHIVSMMNYFEHVVAAYANCVADEKIITDHLRNPIDKWVHALGNFNEIAEQEWGYQPWEPLIQMVSFWNSKHVRIRPPT
jgi:hypothetical protein